MYIFSRLVRPLFGVVLLLGIAPVWAGTGIDRLHGFFTGLKTIQADFEQTVEGSHFVNEPHSQGTFTIARPDRFRWHYQKPYQQLIVADGRKVWIYDPDLEQVTVRPMGASLGDTPAMLLSGGQPLEQNFTLKELGEKDGLAWVELRPKAEDVSFTRVQLGFGENGLQRMILEDSLGQTTRLDFSNVRRNQPVDAALFTFQAPPGVDVFNAGE